MSKKSRSGRQVKNPDSKFAPRRVYMFISYLFVLISFLSASLAVFYFYVTISGQDVPAFVAGYSRPVGAFFILIFLGYLTGMYGILKPQPPLNHISTVTSVLNFIFNFIAVLRGDSTGTLLAMLSFIHVYLGYRFPLDLSYDATTFKK